MNIRVLALFILMYVSSHAQTRKVLFEEITGAYCGNCPSAAWIVDSLTKKYPNLIGVAVHSYGVPDAMYFPGCDSIDNLINTQGGAPFGDLDRMKYAVTNAPLYMLFSNISKYDSIAAARLSVPAMLTVSIIPTWTSITRTISAQVNVHILSNLSAADYRISMYVVEDSVMETGAGYDQENLYNTSPPGNPFYGMGNPIIGYVHRHVSRAALPSPLGAAGVLPFIPAAGQDFLATMNYNLPSSMNENRISLLAFVYKYAPTGANNEILNAEEVKLIPLATGINSALQLSGSASVFPNPFTSELFLNSNETGDVVLYDVAGKEILRYHTSEAKTRLRTETIAAGFYLVRIGKDNFRVVKEN